MRFDHLLTVKGSHLFKKINENENLLLQTLRFIIE